MDLIPSVQITLVVKHENEELIGVLGLRQPRLNFHERVVYGWQIVSPASKRLRVPLDVDMKRLQDGLDEVS